MKEPNSETGRSIFYRTALGNVFAMVIFPVVLGITIPLVRLVSSFANGESPFFYLGIILMIIGWCALVRSKWDQVRKGDFFSFGISKTHPEMKWLYRASYFAMVFGWLMACLSGLIRK